jgi:hypothetical protein
MVTCPLCRGQRIRRSRRRGVFERRVLILVFLRPFRCLSCDNRFFRGSLAAHPDVFRPAGTQ